MCSPELSDVVDPKNMTEEEIKEEEAKFKDIVFLKRSDSTRYGELLKDLANGEHLKHDEYPKSETEALDGMLVGRALSIVIVSASVDVVIVIGFIEVVEDEDEVIILHRVVVGVT